MEEILNILSTLVGTVVSIGFIYLLRNVTAYIKANLSESEQAKLEKFVESLVGAAEQLHKKDDQDGSARLGYVQGMLIEAGYELTDAVMALVESKVQALNAKTPKNE